MTGLALAWGTLSLRPYVLAFLVTFLAMAVRDVGARGAAVWLGWGFAVALAAELASTRVGVPFGLYHYTGETRGVELYVGNVPFFDPLSFPFLAYASWCVARWSLRRAHGAPAVALAGALMMLLDVVIDPAAARGDRWFLGRVFYYPEGGVYFGVPLSNFAGWIVVGWLITGGHALFSARLGRASGSPLPGVGLYYGVLVFNLAITAWIGERALLAAGILLHGALFLVLFSRVRARAGRAPGVRGGGGSPAGREYPRGEESHRRP
jgi:putative membrane protein